MFTVHLANKEARFRWYSRRAADVAGELSESHPRLTLFSSYFKSAVLLVFQLFT